MNHTTLKHAIELVEPSIPLLSKPIVAWRYKWWVDNTVHEDCTVLPIRGVRLTRTGPAKQYTGDRHGHYAGHTLYLTRNTRGRGELVEMIYGGNFSDQKGAPSELTVTQRTVPIESAAELYDIDELVMAIYTALCRYIDLAPERVTQVMRERTLEIMRITQNGTSSSPNTGLGCS